MFSTCYDLYLALLLVTIYARYARLRAARNIDARLYDGMNQPCKIDLDKLGRLRANVKSHSDDYSTRSSRCAAKKIALARKNETRGTTCTEIRMAKPNRAKSCTLKATCVRFRKRQVGFKWDKQYSCKIFLVASITMTFVFYLH